MLPSSGNENIHCGGTLEIMECLLSFDTERFVFQFAVQKFKD